jgi:hypothetical protein
MSEVLDKPAPAKEDKRAVFLAGERMHLREEVRQDWVIDAAAGTTVEDVLDPQYLAHLAPKIERYSRIEVLVESGEWMLDLLVMGVGRNWVKTRLLKKHELEPVAETLETAERYTVEYKGAHRKHAVIRKADQQVIQDGFPNRVEALAWLANHERVTTTAA